MYHRFVVTGSSRGGKTALLGELARRGYATFQDPGRRVIREQQMAGGTALPWLDAAAFAEQTMKLARADYEAAPSDPTFYDRSCLDPLIWHERTGTPLPDCAGEIVGRLRYADPVFLVPPWPELFTSDPARPDAWDDAITEYEALLAHLPRHGYRICVLPQDSVAARADLVEAKVKDAMEMGTEVA
ncbi:hypothetical protein OG2516_05793 [Oceanicola granulosus HTCC2516]|uniref:NadR/Ttd14 AAA domain-containing protein n=1 Tax=Oceanicola granulosus (strain ATCC BAA-861 / DSM 15982 / KCTC 12143 / HTCC2516) TaxID=314256 RepID=Q2CIJ3_OCEGH|nr:AAA family ATPase [Oceanicola granulosus]EAR52596.1 hypothetical protein OG2516_05793 [Oceanicola granulosus HTCC2516]